MQSKEELDASYVNPDPWGYQTNPEDIRRKHFILSIIHMVAEGRQYRKSLDIGAGEAWITKDIPSNIIHGYELSDTAFARWPKNVLRVQNFSLKYDLVLATGVLYPHYDYKTMIDGIRNVATGLVITSHIKGWGAYDDGFGSLIFKGEFPYREFNQELKVWRVNVPIP